MRLPLSVVLLSTAAPFLPLTSAPAPVFTAAQDVSAQTISPSGIVDQVPDWVEPPGETSCLFMIEPLTGEARDLNVNPIHLPHLDILPHHCPNNLHVGDDDDDDDDDDDHDSLRVAALTIGVLGNDFDVTQVDLNTTRLSRFEPLLSATTWPLLAPFQWSYKDVGTPFEGAPCGCNSLSGDGVLDIKLKFDRNQVIEAFGLANEPNGTNVLLRFSGRSPAGIGFRVYDCIHIVND